MDERRIQKNGELLVEYANIETKVMPIIQKCLDNMKDNGNSVNGAQVLWKGHNLQLPCVQHIRSHAKLLIIKLVRFV